MCVDRSVPLGYGQVFFSGGVRERRSDVVDLEVPSQPVYNYIVQVGVAYAGATGWELCRVG